MVTIVPGKTVNRQGHVVMRVTTHKNKTGEEFADGLMIAPDLNDLNEQGEPKCYYLPLFGVEMVDQLSEFVTPD